MVAKRKAYRILVGKLEGKRPLERPRHVWMDNIKIRIDLREVSLDRIDWIDLTEVMDQ
jgi:hypothetical protein